MFTQNSFLFLLIVIIVASFCVAFLFNMTESSWTNGLGILKSFFALPLFFGIVTTLLLKKNLLRFSHLAWLLFASIGLQGMLGYFYVIQDRLTYDGRLIFIYDSPNYFAIILAIGIILGVYLLQNVARPEFNILSKLSLNKTVIILFLIANGFSLLMTQSLGAWLGLAVALGYYFFFKNYSVTARSISVIILFLFFVFLIVVFGLNDMLHFFEYSPSSPPTSLDSRIAIYLSSKKILLDNFLIGIGPGNFQNSYLAHQHFFPPYPQWAVPHAHNIILHYWIEGGLFAAISLMLLLGNLLVFAKTKTAPAGAVVLAVLIYFSAHGLIDVPLWKNDLAVIFWTFVCYSIINRTLSPKV